MSEVAVAIWNSKTKKYVDISYRRIMVRKSLDEICHYAEVEASCISTESCRCGS